jgi:hypothetical protein
MQQRRKAAAPVQAANPGAVAGMPATIKTAAPQPPFAAAKARRAAAEQCAEDAAQPPAATAPAPPEKRAANLPEGEDAPFVPVFAALQVYRFTMADVVDFVGLLDMAQSAGLEVSDLLNHLRPAIHAAHAESMKREKF